MKNKTLRQSIVSLTALGIFILLVIGSIPVPYEIEKEDLGEGVYKETVDYFDGWTEVYKGKQDSEGRYQGPYTITTYDDDGDWHTEEVVMVNGRRHGKCDVTYENGTSSSDCYNMGVKVDCPKKSAQETKAATSAYQVLLDRYPWFVYKLNTLGFDDVYIEAYLDTAEILLDQHALDEEYFNDYFDMIVSDLEETPYDSIIILNEALSYHQGAQEMKHSELRIAVINRYRSDDNTTYNLVNTSFPNYLVSIKEAGVDDTGFENFCHVLDSCMDSNGALYLEDPFFIDSIDSWFSESLINIYESDEYDAKGVHWSENDIRFSDTKDFRKLYTEIKSAYKSLPLKSNPPEVASIALSFMYQRFEHGDILKRAAREAYILNKGVVRLPVVTTVFSKSNSTTSVNLAGYIIEDGGAEVTTNGIVWAIHYNPTTDDQSITSETRSGGFTVTLDGLNEGTTYYARTYATNSAGTVYGNCISFVATAPTGIKEHESVNHNFSIYPNPASKVTTFSFLLDGTESISLNIIDMNGRLVFEHDPGILILDKNQIRLDLSDLPNGLYTCLLIQHGTAIATQNLVIAH